MLADLQADLRQLAQTVRRLEATAGALAQGDAPSVTTPPDLLPVWPDAGRALGGIGRTKVYDLIGSGDLRTVTIGRRRFVPRTAVEEYIAKIEAVDAHP